MNYFKKLLNASNTYEGKIELSIFISNVFLLCTHIFLMIFYILVKSWLMILINIYSIAIYVYFRKKCVQRPYLWTNIAFFEIWIHIIFAVLSFGLNLGFQNWIYGLITSFFLPVISNTKKKIKRSYIIGTVFVSTYYLLAIALNIFHFKPFITLNNAYVYIMFIINTAVSFTGIFVLTYFYTSLHKSKQAELTKKAEYDELTSLYNRYALNELGNIRINEANNEKSTFDIAIIDIDYFKNINDTYGHDIGDKALEKIADILRIFSIKGIVPVRWGGEEFILLSTTSINHEEFIKIIEKMRIYIDKKEFKIGGNNVKLTISAGIASYRNKQTLEQLIKLADENLYKAKETGRNKVIY